MRGKVGSEEENTIPFMNGYRSDHLPIGNVEGNVEAAGGVAAYSKLWVDHEAEQSGWRGAQLSLF